MQSRNSRELGILNRLAEAVAATPNVRLEVYWLGDEPDTEPTRLRVLAYVDDARALLESGRFDSAAISAWAGLEGALELYVADTDAPIPSHSEHKAMAWQKATELYSVGYISEADYESLDEARKLRNAAVHFTSGSAPNPAAVHYLLGVVERMANGKYASTDQMIEWYIDANDYPDAPLTGEQRNSIRRVLAGHFPGAPDRDLEEAVTRLEHDAAI